MLKRYHLLWMLIACFLLLLSASQVWADDTTPNHLLSANIPLDSYIYSYIEKLSSLGYLGLLDGTKPYRRMEVAKWVLQIEENISAEYEVPAYVQTMLTELEGEFAKEILALKDGERKSGFMVRYFSFTTAYLDGASLEQPQTDSHYQPLNINHNGYQIADDFNAACVVNVEGDLGNWLLLSATPHLAYNDEDDATFSFESAYLKTHLGNMEIMCGKDAIAWGQGQRGNLLFSGNSAPQTIIKLSTIDPMNMSGILRFLDGSNLTFFCSAPESDRSDVRNPNLTGMRWSFKPSPNFTYSLAGGAILGGEGHEIGWRDLGDLITGNNSGSAANDKWDSIAGIDFSWRLPGLGGLQIYGEYYGEDQKNHPIIQPFLHAYIFGFYLPKLTSSGDWDLRFETAKTTKVWYAHWLYTDGFVYRDNIIGDAMGNSATRYYLNVTHYLNNARLGFNLERVEMGNNLLNPQTVNAFWLSYRTNVWTDMELSGSAGFAQVNNLGFNADETDRDYLLSIGVTRKF